jgi:hypothetical protein
MSHALALDVLNVSSRVTVNRPPRIEILEMTVTYNIVQ